MSERSATRTRTPGRNGQLRKHLEPLIGIAVERGQLPVELLRETCDVAVMASGGPSEAVENLATLLLQAEVERRKLAEKAQRVSAQNEELIGAYQELKQKPCLGWVISHPVPFADEGLVRRGLLAMSDERPGVLSPFRFPDFNGDEPPPLFSAVREMDETAWPDPPFRALLEPHLGLFVGPATAFPRALSAEFRDARSVLSCGEDGLCPEIEVEEQNSATRSVFATREVADAVRERLQAGDAVQVRIEAGVATAVHDTSEQVEDWVTVIPEEGPLLRELVFPERLHRLWQRDVQSYFMGRPVGVLLIGTTGVGKTEGVIRFTRTLYAEAATRGIRKKGIRVVRISSWSVGSSFIHDTERRIARAIKKARKLSADGYVAVILFDEVDALLGESAHGLEHAHQRTERLSVQELLNDIPPDVPVFGTTNKSLNAPLKGRLKPRPYPRPVRLQLQRVAALAVARRPEVLSSLGMDADQFGAILADALYSDSRVLAVAHMFSGATLPIRARDLQTCSPRAVTGLVETLADDLEDGFGAGVEHLHDLVDAEFSAIDLRKDNLWEQVFLGEPADDQVKTVDVLR